MDEFTKSKRRAKLARAALRTMVLQELDVYCNEAEHQDGYGYYDQFKDSQELQDDFARYLASRSR